jgi:hypothetical protein
MGCHILLYKIAKLNKFSLAFLEIIISRKIITA